MGKTMKGALRILGEKLTNQKKTKSYLKLREEGVAWEGRKSP